jgi:NUMOD3 motif
MIPGTEWFPWDDVVEEDRDYGTVCWIWNRPFTSGSITTHRTVKRLLEQTVGERQPGQLWMHLCEKFREQNLCVRPDHIVMGTKSANAAHSHALRAAAGIPHAPIRPPHSAETRAKMSAARLGREFTPEWRAALSKAQKEATRRDIDKGPYLCDSCGREFSRSQSRSRHMKLCLRRI